MRRSSVAICDLRLATCDAVYATVGKTSCCAIIPAAQPDDKKDIQSGQHLARILIARCDVFLVKPIGVSGGIVMDATILVIEENLDLSRLFEHLLRVDGYRVVSFHHWQQAQAALRAARPDLIIFDWALTNTSGYLWAAQLRMVPETEQLPILFVCGDPPTRGVIEMLGSAGIAVIDKPFDIFVFRNRLEALLARERVVGVAQV
jgi:PleD family two-component response regulator